MDHCNKALTDPAIDLPSSPWIYSCSFGLADPGILVTQRCLIFLIELNAAPHTA